MWVQHTFEKQHIPGSTANMHLFCRSGKHPRDGIDGTEFVAGAAKVNAQKKTEAALQDLKTKQRDCETKLTDLQRRIDDTTDEVKALLQKGQREKAKLVLRRKNMLEKQVTSVQNVCHSSTSLVTVLMYDMQSAITHSISIYHYLCSTLQAHVFAEIA